MWLPASLLCLAPLLGAGGQKTGEGGTAHIDCKDVFGIVGENITFPVEIDRKVGEITWKKNKHYVARWEDPDKWTYFDTLQGRTVLMENGSLTILHLEPDDAGPYELHYWDFLEDHYLNFQLFVLDPLPGPEISCNTSDGKLVLSCTAGFPRPLNYSWKLSNNPRSSQNLSELSIPLENVDTTTSATCIIKFSQTERSSEISLIQCLPEAKGSSSYKRNRGALWGVLVLFAAVLIVGILVLLRRKGIFKFGTGRRTTQNNVPVNGLGEHEQLFPGDSQQQPNSEGAAFSHAVHGENEEPEADRALNEEDSALKDKQIVKNGVNQEEVTQDAEGGKGEHLNNSPSCSREDLNT